MNITSRIEIQRGSTLLSLQIYIVAVVFLYMLHLCLPWRCICSMKVMPLVCDTSQDLMRETSKRRLCKQPKCPAPSQASISSHPYTPKISKHSDRCVISTSCKTLLTSTSWTIRDCPNQCSVHHNYILDISGATDSMLARALAGSLGGGELSHSGPWQRVHKGVDLEGEFIAWRTA